jgi:hypothetical protein
VKAHKKRFSGYKVVVGLNGMSRELSIINEETQSEYEKFKKSIIEPFYRSKSANLFNLNLTVSLKKIGISIISDTPSELFYISFDNLYTKII